MKKIKIIGVIVTFIVSIVLHFVYSWFPNTFFSIILPVNESIWEHMKLIITSSLIFSIIEYFIYRKKDIKFNNFLFAYAVTSILGIITYLIIYIPLNDIFGHKTIIAISLLFVIFIFIQLVSYYIMSSKKIKYSNVMGLLLIIFMYIIFGYFTYYPPHINLFYDYLNRQYGIIKSS